MADEAWALGGGVSLDADTARWATAALAGDVGGVCGVGDLAVSQDDTPGMRVKVAAGYVLVRGGSTPDQGMYAWRYPGGTVDVAPGDPSNPRNDIVGVQIEDDEWDASGENRARLVVVSGTPAGSPSDPVLPASFVSLARVRVDQNESTSILNADIDDLRTYAGIYYATSTLLQRMAEGTAYLRHVPGGDSDVGGGPGVLATLGSLTVPAWATEAIVTVSVTALTWASPPATHVLSIGVGSANSSADASIDSGGLTWRGVTWTSLVTGISSGSQSLTVRAQRTAGSGFIRSGSAARWTADVRFK